MGRPSAVVTLDAIERETLQGYMRRFTSAQALAKRARIILLLALTLKKSLRLRNPLSQAS